MAETIQLTVEPRETIGKAGKKLRRHGLLPGVLYGYNVDAPLPIQIDGRLFERVYHRAGFVHLVEVHVGETGPVAQALVNSVKRDPVTHALAHVDLKAVNPRLEITGRVPIVVTGESPAVRNDLGMLLHALGTVEIRALPDAMPNTIDVDAGSLDEVGATIYVRDLTIPAGVTLMTDPDEVVVRVTALRAVREEEVEATEAAQAEAAETDEAEDAGA